MKPFMHLFSLLAGLGILTVVRGAVAAEPTAEGLAFFEKKIRTVLVEKCYKCHSANSEKLKGKLRLDTREGIRKGGESGHAVVPKDLEESLLIEAIRYGDEDTAMPPKERLPAAVVARADTDAVTENLTAAGETVFPIGSIQRGDGGVTIVGGEHWRR